MKGDAFFSIMGFCNGSETYLLLSAVFYDFLWKMAEKDWKSKERWYAFFDRICDRYIY